jgi:cell division protein ZapE
MTSDLASEDSALGPLARYRHRVAAGGLKADPCQELAAEKLESLAHALAEYRPAEGGGGWRERLGLARRPDPAPQGLYIFGAVGRGKSMLMDLFFAAAPVERKRRVHFHAFMLEVHERLHALRQDGDNGRNGDPIAPLAAQIAADATLLCFDEFQVTNIADAMILGRLFEAMFARGVVVVATSNTAPDDLYANGLQRDRFLPAIAMLKEKLDVLELDGDVDYRRTRIKGMRVYHTPLGRAATQALGEAFARLTEGATAEPDKLLVQGRTLTIQRAARGVAMATFAELCEKPLWAADYLAIATHFHTLVLDGVPVLRAEQRNEARRFITLIDALYEHRVKLICAAAAVPEQLYATGDHAGEFERTASRLFEMQSEDYLAAPHLT